MPGVTPWKLAQHTTVVTVIGQTPAANGVFVAGASYALVTLLDELEHNVEEEAEDVRPITNPQINEMLLSSGNAVRLVTLKRSDTAALLHLIKKNYPYAYLLWTEGTETFAGYYRVGRMSGGTRGRGKQVAQLEFRPCDPNQAQVAHSTTA